MLHSSDYSQSDRELARFSMKIRALFQILAHPAQRNAIGGTLILGAIYTFVYFYDPDAGEHIPVYFVAFLCALIIFGPLPATYRLVRGSILLSTWKKHFFWFVIVGWGFLIGHSSAYTPEYLPIFYVAFVGGGAVGIGLYTSRAYLVNTSAMALNFLISLAWLDTDALKAYYPYWFMLSLIVVIAAYWEGYASDYYITLNEKNTRLLREIRRDRRTIAKERQRSDELLLNILPQSIAEELKQEGRSQPVHYDEVSVLFTDFQGFTKIAEALTASDLVWELDRCFSYFDAVVARHNLEKLKTIGDSYMCAGGIPIANRTHCVDTILAAMEIQAFMLTMRDVKESQGLPYWELRLGIHCGPLVAGVIGERKFAYDVWGDTVNIASRCESSGAAGRINVSEQVIKRVRDFFDCEYRGKVAAKHKGVVDMYFITGLKPELSVDGDRRTPNADFQILYNGLGKG